MSEETTNKAPETAAPAAAPEAPAPAAAAPAAATPAAATPAAPQAAASTPAADSGSSSSSSTRPGSSSRPGHSPRSGRSGSGGRGRFFRRKKVCKFCVEKIDAIPYRDVRLLQQFVAERGKIVPRRLTGVCTTHQRRLTRAIKQARNIALLPFATKH